MAISPNRAQRRSCMPLPTLQDSLPSPLPTPSSSPLRPFQNSLQLNLPASGATASQSTFSQDRPFREIIALTYDSFQSQSAFQDVFQWPAIDRTPRERDPSLPRDLLVTQSNQSGADKPSELYDLLCDLESSYFEPRLSSEEVPLRGLTISYCGDQTTYMDTKFWSRLTIYHVGDASDERIRSMALWASESGLTELEC